MLRQHQENKFLPAPFLALLHSFETAIANKDTTLFLKLWDYHPALQNWLMGKEVIFENHQPSSLTIDFNNLINWFTFILKSSSLHMITKIWDKNEHLHQIINNLSAEQSRPLLKQVLIRIPSAAYFIKEYLKYIPHLSLLNDFLDKLKAYLAGSQNPSFASRQLIILLKERCKELSLNQKPSLVAEVPSFSPQPMAEISFTPEDFLEREKMLKEIENEPSSLPESLVESFKSDPAITQSILDPALEFTQYFPGKLFGPSTTQRKNPSPTYYWKISFN